MRGGRFTFSNYQTYTALSWQNLSSELCYPIWDGWNLWRINGKALQFISHPFFKGSCCPQRSTPTPLLHYFISIPGHYHHLFNMSDHGAFLFGARPILVLLVQKNRSDLPLYRMLTNPWLVLATSSGHQHYAKKKKDLEASCSHWVWFFLPGWFQMAWWSWWSNDGCSLRFTGWLWNYLFSWSTGKSLGGFSDTAEIEYEIACLSILVLYF